ncbi:hypothetical protein E2C01_080515 [Portunus trituberculatus]|uniref:Uncharacterized protein n=1 Tax=Portunus trituberculatus TaxID=210409 RepID=A0A5B7IWB7_PORTR|nr:hypothetical protein [Portunus trituberculatus]
MMASEEPHPKQTHHRMSLEFITWLPAACCFMAWKCSVGVRLCGRTARATQHTGRCRNLLEFPLFVKHLSGLTTAVLRRGNNTELEYEESLAASGRAAGI